MTNEEKIYKLSNLIRAGFTSELLWLKDRQAPIWNKNDYLNLKSKYHERNVEWDICTAGFMNKQSNEENVSIITNVIKEKHNIVYTILNLFPDNLFLCGGSIIKAICKPLPQTQYNDFDIFFIANSIAQVEQILKKCLCWIKENYPLTYFSFSQGCVTALLSPVLKIQFIRRIYQNPSQILLGFDLWACQHGWNAKIGYFTIPTGALSLVLNIFPIDPTKRSYSYSHRILKYYREKNFNVALPGVETNRNEDINSIDGNFMLKCGNGIFHKHSDEVDGTRYAYGMREGMVPEKCLDNCKASNFRIFYEFDYKSQELGLYNDYGSSSQYNTQLIKLEMFNLITFRSHNWEHVFHVDIEKDYLFLFEVSFIENGSKSTIKENEHYKKILKELNDPKNRWKTNNPGSQRYGINNPIITNPRDWYGYDRPIYYVGIHPDIFVEIYKCWIRSQVWKGMPRDVFKLICRQVCLNEAQF